MEWKSIQNISQTFSVYKLNSYNLGTGGKKLRKVTPPI